MDEFLDSLHHFQVFIKLSSYDSTHPGFYTHVLGFYCLKIITFWAFNN